MNIGYGIALLLVLGGFTTRGQGQETAPPSGYDQLVWSDEFDQPGLPDPQKWSYEQGYIRNGEAQYYTRRRAENARVENGFLIIEARRDSALLEGQVRPITSASLTTQGKHTWTYGHYEVRAQLPSSRGTWAAAWLLGANISRVGWPTCGEIDIMEHVGYHPDTVHCWAHTKVYREEPPRDAHVYLPDATTTFHVYALEWRADRLDFFMDDRRVLSFKNDGSGIDSWAFDHPFFMILNLAFGGTWGGRQGTDPASLPQRLVVDYVRVYQ